MVWGPFLFFSSGVYFFRVLVGGYFKFGWGVIFMYLTFCKGRYGTFIFAVGRGLCLYDEEVEVGRWWGV